MCSNEEIMNNQKHGFDSGQKTSVLQAMKEAQIEVLNELIDRYVDSEDNMLNVVMKLKEELK